MSNELSPVFIVLKSHPHPFHTHITLHLFVEHLFWHDISQNQHKNTSHGPVYYVYLPRKSNQQTKDQMTLICPHTILYLHIYTHMCEYMCVCVCLDVTWHIRWYILNARILCSSSHSISTRISGWGKLEIFNYTWLGPGLDITQKDPNATDEFEKGRKYPHHLGPIHLITRCWPHCSIVWHRLCTIPQQ